MSRTLLIAGAQMGPTQRADSRAQTVARLVALLEQAAARGAKLVVFPELAFTTFFPRWPMERDAPELLGSFEQAMPNPQVQPLFDRARALGVGFYIGYAELTPDGQRFNSAVTVGPDGRILFKYRKIHLPGSDHVKEGQAYQQLEKMYFEYGDMGFPVARGPGEWGRPVLGMLVCNDRRWPEGWRCLGLQGVELVMVGYNSAAYDPNGGEGESAEMRTFHSILAAQSNAYMNATWAIAVAKAGVEGGAGLIGGSCIVDPNGVVVAQAKTTADEVIVAEVDFDACRQGKEKMFNFAAHRRPQWYGRIVEQVGAEVIP
ncbi:N-carbamoyl-D-amino-acid hydrolase [Falsiroseomonas sp. E2-1-a20]|uniref:N-carbamoyl-D-amino-acid hydrolase n=1 Tax=Falsiroseomonas sp. E2-1-a20 TaxID=3239300 RepID=UPI003F3D587C